jgi:hypothetical protein
LDENGNALCGPSEISGIAFEVVFAPLQDQINGINRHVIKKVVGEFDKNIEFSEV